MNNEAMELITDKVFTDVKELVNFVCEDYHRYDTELNSLFFNFNVRMKKRDILLAYSEIQDIINEDSIVYIGGFMNIDIDGYFENDDADYTDIYEGNCMEFLESFNGSGIFARVAEEEIVDFIC